MGRNWFWPCAVTVAVAFGHVCLPVQGQPPLGPGVAGATCEDAARVETSEAAGRSLDDRFQRMEGNVDAALRKLSLDLEQRVERTEAAYGRVVQKFWLDDRAERSDASHSRLETTLQKLSDRIDKLGGHIEGVEAASSSAEAARGTPRGRIEAALQELSDRIEQLGHRIEGVETTSTEAVLKSLESIGSHVEEAANGNTEALLRSVESTSSCVEKVQVATLVVVLAVALVLYKRCIERIEAARGSTEVPLKSLEGIGGRLERVEATLQNTEEVLKSLESIDSRMEMVEVANANTEAVLRNLEGTNGCIEKLEATGKNTEVVLDSLKSIDSRIQKMEVASVVNAEAVTKSLEKIDGRMEAANGSKETLLASLESINGRVEAVETAIRTNGDAQNDLCILQSLEAASGKTEVALQRLDDRLKVMEKTSVAAAEWDLSGMALEGKTEVVSRPFMLAGIQGLTLQLYPKGNGKGTAGHASVYLQGPNDVLVSFRVTLDDTTLTATKPSKLASGWGWCDFCKAGTSFTRARVEVLEVVQSCGG